MKGCGMTRKKSIAMACPVLDGNEKKYVLECLDSGWISSIGRFVELFEREFARYCGSNHAVSCSNGTSALHLALAALDVGPEDEVIVPALTYVATANAVRYCGAKPVFVDSEPRTMTLDPQLLEGCITRRTRGIIPVHLFGHPADMDSINSVARRHGLFVVEDAAEAHGALYRGRKAGSLADAATFSFYGNKIITTGEGGMITTSSAELSERMTILRGQGVDPQRRYWFPVIGYNYRMTNIAAAIGVAQLERIDRFLELRLRLAAAYHARLSPLGEFLQLPSEQPWARHAYWSYTVILRDAACFDRDELMDRLGRDGIETRPVFYPMHTLPPYFDNHARFPVAENLGSRGISLPMHALLAEEDVTYVADRLGYWCGQLTALSGGTFVALTGR
jgi:perosamine synthetase